MTTTASPETEWKRVRPLLFVQLFLIVASFAVLVTIWFGVQSLEKRRDAAKRELDGLREQLLAADQQLQAQNAVLELSERELSAVRDGLTELQAKSTTPDQRDSIAATLKVTEDAERRVQRATAKKPRIHILYAGDQQRDVATRLETALRAEGYTVRPPTNIKGTAGRPATDMTQVRFMRPEDRASAFEILSRLQANDIRHARISYVPDRQTPAGRIEIWFEAGDIR